MKRLNYEQVRITTIGGVLECKPAANGWSVTFHPHADQPQVSHGKDIEEAGQNLVNNLKRTINSIEDDLKAFVERNK